MLWYLLCDGFTYFSQRVGVATTLPDEVPFALPLDDASNNEWYCSGNSLFHNHSTTKYFHLPSLHDFKVNNTIGLLLLPNGELHLFLDRKKSAKVATGLPVHKSLVGAVNVLGRCSYQDEIGDTEW